MRKSFQKPSAPSTVSNVGAKCQKCLKEGHWTADCTNERVYKARPSRTALLFNPKLKLPEASIVKNDFIDEKQMNKIETTEFAKEDIEVPDADTFAQQLIEEVKQSDNLRSRESGEKEHYDKYDSRRSHRRRSRSRSYSPRQRSLSRSPLHRSKSPQPENINRRNEKKYTQYASDSDFSSDSD